MNCTRAATPSFSLPTSPTLPSTLTASSISRTAPLLPTSSPRAPRDWRLGERQKCIARFITKHPPSIPERGVRQALPFTFHAHLWQPAITRRHVAAVLSLAGGN